MDGYPMYCDGRLKSVRMRFDSVIVYIEFGVWKVGREV